MLRSILNNLVSFDVDFDSGIVHKNSIIRLPSISSPFSLFIVVLLITVLANISASAQENTSFEIEQRTEINEDDSLIILRGDSISADSLLKNPITNIDTTITRKDTTLSKDAIKTKVDYVAEDSMKIDMVKEKVFLFGNAQVNYEQIQLNAAYIEVDLKNNRVKARGAPDSSGAIVGRPVFKEGNQEYFVDSMTYQTDTKKGKIYEAKTQEGEGFIKGSEIKKTGTEVLYIRNGYYTTCNLDTPHFSLATSKLKVIPGDKIITGPTVLKIDNVPTPLGLPFGFFPNTKERSSGILIPTYGDSRNLGFFLTNGGFYLGINEYVDASITGDIYSLGSWGTTLNSRYRKRYKYNGNVNISYAKIKQGYEEFPSFSETNNFFVTWQHSQDSKARPGSQFSANVNAGSQANYRNNINSSSQDFLTNTFQSSVSYSNSFPGKPFNLNISARHNQNTQTGAFNVSLPDISFNVSRLNFLKSVGKIGNEWWRGAYKNLGVSYTSSATNQLNTFDSLLVLDNLDQLASEMRNGVQHSIPISTSFKLFKYANLTPSMNVREVWVFKTIRKRVDTSGTVVNDTVGGFERGGTVNFNASMNTRFFSLYQYRKGKIAALRHVMTPTVSFNFQPEVSSGLRSYQNTNIPDSLNQNVRYSIFEGSVYGAPNRTRSGSIGLGLMNNLEMKVRTKKDSSGLKKITLLESLSFTTNYNLSADSLNWSTIQMNGRTKISQFLQLQFSGTLDPYSLDSAGARINESQFTNKGYLSRLTAASVALNFRLTGGKKDKKKEKKESKYATDQELEYINANPDQYIDFSIPWSLNVNYNIRYSKPTFESATTQTLNFSGDLSLTEKWKISATSGWDIERRDFTYTSLNINRDLHCWQLSINWIPYGIRQSYNLTLNVKSAVLQDLKLNRNRNFIDAIR